MSAWPDNAAAEEVRALVVRALAEDLADAGDITTQALVDVDRQVSARLLARDRYVVCGLGVAAMVFHELSADVELVADVADGDWVEAGATIARIAGPARAILAAERTALNFMQRLMGIASRTRKFAEIAKPYGVAVLDTRKTTPTLRRLERYAVRCGGGQNHRFGLYDRILIKDNHRALLGEGPALGLAEAIRRARERYPDVVVEAEVESIAELEQALAAEADWILLDNMPPEKLRECVALRRGRSRLEASGGINLDSFEAVAATGVDAVSLGALTHSVVAADLSLEFETGD